MQLTEEQIKSNLAAYEHAMRTGSVDAIECGSSEDNWGPKFGVSFDYVSRYRIRPTPKLRPWKPEEVPVGAIVRYAKNDKSVRMLIRSSLEPHLLGETSRWTLDDLFKSMEHSLTGINGPWLPCGVMEEQQ